MITRDGHTCRSCERHAGVEMLQSSHPVPDERSLAAGARLLRWVDELPAARASRCSWSPAAPRPGGGARGRRRACRSRAAHPPGIRSRDADRRAECAPRGALAHQGRQLAARLGGRAARALFVSDVPQDDPRGHRLGTARARRRRARTTCSARWSRASSMPWRGLPSTAAPSASRCDRRGGASTAMSLRLAVRFSHELHLTPAQCASGAGSPPCGCPRSRGAAAEPTSGAGGGAPHRRPSGPAAAGRRHRRHRRSHQRRRRAGRRRDLRAPHARRASIPTLPCAGADSGTRARGGRRPGSHRPHRHQRRRPRDRAEARPGGGTRSAGSRAGSRPGCCNLAPMRLFLIEEDARRCARHPSTARRLASGGGSCRARSRGGGAAGSRSFWRRDSTRCCSPTSGPGAAGSAGRRSSPAGSASHPSCCC